jgi:hypothetical protein
MIGIPRDIQNNFFDGRSGSILLRPIVRARVIFLALGLILYRMEVVLLNRTL